MRYGQKKNGRYLAAPSLYDWIGNPVKALIMLLEHNISKLVSKVL